MPKDEDRKSRRSTIELGQEFYERLAKWKVEPNQSFSSVIRRVLSFGLAFLEALEELGIELPHPKAVRSWLQALIVQKNQPQAQVIQSPATVGLLLQDKLSSKSIDATTLSKTIPITTDRLNAILRGEEPAHAELSLLSHFLDLPLEKLEKIRQSQFGIADNIKEKINGYK